MKNLLFLLLIVPSVGWCFALKTQQIVVVTSQDWDKAVGNLQRYQFNDGRWVKEGQTIPVVLGKKGMALDKKLADSSFVGPIKQEGDMRTPAGFFPITQTFGFADNPKILNMPYVKLTPTTVCVDDSESAHYNQMIDSNYTPIKDWKSAESMHEIPLYTWGAFVRFNKEQIVGKGSCIFLHIWRNAESGTAGCVAMSADDLMNVIHWLDIKKNPYIFIIPVKEANAYLPWDHHFNKYIFS